MASSKLAELRNLASRSDVAAYLGISDLQLRYLIYARPKSKRYLEFSIPKRRGGARQILAPADDLKAVQRLLAEKLSAIYTPRKAVHGFAKHHSIVSNADCHTRRRYVFNVDLADFFPSINFGRVRGLFIKLGASINGATVLAQLCCHEGSLPQGAPTSPIISNMVCYQLDRRISEIAQKHKCVYTRYADDITISRRRSVFPPEIGYIDESGNAIIGRELRAAIEDSGFKINNDKVWLFNNKHRQCVTGLTVNAKCNVPRRFVRQVRAMIYAWRAHGYENAEAEHAEKYYRRDGRKGAVPPFREIIRGKLEFIKMVKGTSDPVYRNLQTQLVKVWPEYIDTMKKENNEMSQRDAFISHATEDKTAIARPLADALIANGFTVWFDEYEIKIGDRILDKVDEGLSQSRFGIVIVSKNFLSRAKQWPKREIAGLTAREDAEGRSLILPIWYRIKREDIAAVSPTLAGIRALIAKHKSPEQMVSELAGILR